jgi:hypothetical protein
MDSKKTHAAAVALGVLLGAGSIQAVGDAHAVSAQVMHLRMLGDGQLALGVLVKIGSGTAGRELVWDAKGGNPRLNGKPIKDEAAARLGAAATSFAASCAIETPKLADRLGQP